MYSKQYYLGLGLDFEDNLRWNLTKQRLLSKAKGRLAMLSKALSEGLPFQAALNVVVYGSSCSQLR